MDSVKIHQLLMKTIDSKKCSVAGVFPRDLVNIDNVQRFPACCIANIDDSHRPGQHWVAYYFRTPNEYEFFDSYGFTPSHYGFTMNSPYLFNTIPFQSDFSNTCGHFCLYFLHSKNLGFSLPNILHSFSPINLKWNDKLVKKFVSKISNSRYFVHSSSLPKPSSQFSIIKRLVFHN